MTWLSVPLAGAFFLYLLISVRRSRLFTAETIFAALQALMALGSFPMLDSNLEADRIYAVILLYTSIAFMVTTTLLISLQPRATSRLSERRVAPPAFVPTIPFWALLIISTAVTVAYFQAVGYSALLRGLANAFLGGDADIAGLRLDAYSGSQYFFPGYVNQFKNALLPALVVIAITYWRTVRARRTLISALLCGGSTFALVATGQRGAFVLFVAVLIVYIYAINGDRLPKRVIMLGGLVFFTIIAFTTIALGRSSIGASTTLLGQIAAAIEQFIERILTSNQSAGVIGFRYIHDIGPVYDGSEWVQSFFGLLPGYRGSDLASQIFALRYGSPRGTSPPSIWGSIYYNFGPIGVTLAPVVLAVLYRRVSKASSSGARNSLHAMGIAGTSVIAGFWVSGSPTFLMNNGLAVYLALWWWGARANEKALPASQRKASFGSVSLTGT